MKSKPLWKPASRLDNVMNALLIVLALAPFGLSVWEVEWNPQLAWATGPQHA